MPGISDKEQLIRHFKNRTTPLFFIHYKDKGQIVNFIKNHYPDTIQTTIEKADDICNHIFDILGSGRVYLSSDINWHQDFKTGHHWPIKFYADIVQIRLEDNSDVKIPWELSRCHHFLTLGKAYWYTHDEKYSREFVKEFTDWIKKNPPWSGINWCCTMEVSIRMVNWIWAFYFFFSSPHFDDHKKVFFLKSIYYHCIFITENFEYYGEYSNNHYLANIVGLFFAGVLFPEFKKSKKWRKISLNEILNELDMQVLEDGADFEGSISYHRLVLEMFVSALILCQKNSLQVPQQAWSRLEKMFEYVLHYTKPNGMSPQIGDTDNGRLQVLAANLEVMDHRYLLSIGAVLFERHDFKFGAGSFHEEAFWLLAEKGYEKFKTLSGKNEPLSSKCFPQSGLYIMRNKESYIAVDCGPNGRNGKGNHSHNDALSFELYAYDKTFIVDPGTYTYTAEPEWRNIFRSTKNHNTVMVDGEEINRFVPDQLFQLNNDAVPNVNVWKPTMEADFLDAQHNGYERLTAPVTHRRQFYFNKFENYLIIRDLLNGVGYHTLSWQFLFDIGIPLGIQDTHTFATQCQKGANLLIYTSADPEINIEVNGGWISPYYGLKKEIDIAKYTWAGELPFSACFLIFPYVTETRKNRYFQMLRDRVEYFENIWGLAA